MSPQQCSQIMKPCNFTYDCCHGSFCYENTVCIKKDKHPYLFILIAVSILGILIILNFYYTMNKKNNKEKWTINPSTGLLQIPVSKYSTSSKGVPVSP